MRNLFKISILALVAFWIPNADAQSVTPNTTLCGAVSLTATSICLTATTGSSPNWGIYNQTGVYVDNEFMLVQLTASQTVTGTNQYVPVSRSNRSGPGAPTTHANGAIAWIANVPSASTVPGSNGFTYGTEFKDVGTCTRASQDYLPHIWVDLGTKRDCSSNATSTTSVGYWVDYNEYGSIVQGTVQTLTAATITVSPSSGNYVLNGTATETITVAAPTSTVQDGTILRFSSNTAHAHVISMSGLILNGATGGPYNTATLAAFAGASVTFMAYQGKWMVISSVGTVTYA